MTGSFRKMAGGGGCVAVLAACLVALATGAEIHRNERGKVCQCMVVSVFWRAYCAEHGGQSRHRRQVVWLVSVVIPRSLYFFVKRELSRLLFSKSSRLSHWQGGSKSGKNI